VVNRFCFYFPNIIERISEPGDYIYDHRSVRYVYETSSIFLRGLRVVNTKLTVLSGEISNRGDGGINMVRNFF